MMTLSRVGYQGRIPIGSWCRMNSCHRCDIVFGPGWFCDAAGEETLWWVLIEE